MGSQMNSISAVSSVSLKCDGCSFSSTPEIPWSKYLNQKYKYQSLQNHICLKLSVFCSNLPKTLR